MFFYNSRKQFVFLTSDSLPNRNRGGVFLVGFVIGMLSTARLLKLLRRTTNGGETILDVKKGGQNGGAYVATFIDWVTSPGPGRLFDSKSLSKTIPHDLRKATNLTIVTALQSAVLQTHLQHLKENVCVIWVPNYVYMTRWLCIHD